MILECPKGFDGKDDTFMIFVTKNQNETTFFQSHFAEQFII